MKAKPKMISLNAELAQLCDALDAAKILADALQNEGFDSEDEQRRAPGAISAVLALVACRIKNLGQLVRGTLDAEGFWTRQNAAPDRPSSGADLDVLIRAERCREPSKPRGK